MLQNKLHVFVASFTVYRVLKLKGERRNLRAREREERMIVKCLARTCLISELLGDHQYLCVLFYCRYSVENAYLEEKEDTCNALGEVAENSG